MADDNVEKIVELISARNVIDDHIAGIIKRPVASGHLGEWLAAQIFGIELEVSATAAAIDGRFKAGPLAGKTVNMKWYLKREGLLDITEADALDHYLVLAGPTVAAASSCNTTRRWCFNAVYLFDARQLLAEQRARSVKLGVASSVTNGQWQRAEIYPHATNPMLPVTPDQSALLALFHGDRSSPG